MHVDIYALDAIISYSLWNSWLYIAAVVVRCIKMAAAPSPKIDMIYNRMAVLGINVDAMKKMNLSENEIGELLRKIEDLLKKNPMQAINT